MAHPIMFTDEDPGLRELRDLCGALPGAVESVAHGRPQFKAGEKGKVFAMYGGSRKVRPGEHERHPYAVLFFPDETERGALEEDDRFFSPAYVGPYGWLGLDVDGPDTDWAEVAELVETSYRRVAAARLLAELDAR